MVVTLSDQLPCDPTSTCRKLSDNPRTVSGRLSNELVFFNSFLITKHVCCLYILRTYYIVLNKVIILPALIILSVTWPAVKKVRWVVTPDLDKFGWCYLGSFRFVAYPVTHIRRNFFITVDLPQHNVLHVPREGATTACLGVACVSSYFIPAGKPWRICA